MIIIKEQDNTSRASVDYENFTVVMPLYVASTESTTTESNNAKSAADWDENGVWEVTSSSKFKEFANEQQNSTVIANTIYAQAYQMTYELLRLGYVVLCKKYNNATALAEFSWWEALTDRAIYDFRYVCSGCYPINDTAGNTQVKGGTQLDTKAICRMAIALAALVNKNNVNPGRGDCFALIDLGQSLYSGQSQKTAITNIKSAVNAFVDWKTTAGVTNTDKLAYSEFLAPYINYKSGIDQVFTAKNATKITCLPGSFHYLTCAANSFNVLGYNPWFAVAGEERGKSVYEIDKPDCIFGESALKELMPRYYDSEANTDIKAAVNLVIKTRKGFLLWGNRTAKILPKKAQNGEVQEDLTAGHFLNIRQLCCTLKKQIYIACRRFSFNPNSDILWVNFCDAIRPILEKMKAYEGIGDYEFVKLVSKERATLKALIRIVPIEAVEDFRIGVTLEDSITGTVDVSFLED